MKSTICFSILFYLSVITFGQVQSTDQPIQIRNSTNCVLRFAAFCSSNGTCDPSDEDNIVELTDQAVAPYSLGSVSQCPATYPYFAYLEFSFDTWITSHLVTFDPDLGNNCAGLVDCDNYNIPYGYNVGVLDEDCTGDDGGIRVNGVYPTPLTCTMFFTDFY